MGFIKDFAKKLASRTPNHTLLCRATDDSSGKRLICDAAALGDLVTCYPRSICSHHNNVNGQYDCASESITSYVQKLRDARGTGGQIKYLVGKYLYSHAECKPNIRLLPEMQQTVNRVEGFSLHSPFQIFAQGRTGRKITIQSFESDTVWMIKTKIRAQEGIPND